MSNPLKAWLECSHCDGAGVGQEQTPWKSNPCEHCDGAGGRLVLLTPTDVEPRLGLVEDFVTELLRGSMINQNSSNIEGEVRQLVLNLTRRWDAAVGTTWTIKETDG